MYVLVMVMFLNDFINKNNYFMAIKSRRMSWVGQASCMGEMRNSSETSSGRPEGKETTGKT
jgi:hypothetical protein